jgi:cell wall-associated NlpC family hydrolase
MTDRIHGRRRTARWLVALALFPLLLSTVLPALAVLVPPTAQTPDAPPVVATPTGYEGRDLILPLDGSEDQGVLLGSRGGYLLPVPETSPAVPTDAVQPTAAPEAPATEPVEDPTLGAELFTGLLLTVLPADRIEALPDYFLPDDAVFYVKSDFLNLREGPGTDYAILHKLGYAEKVTRTAVGLDWSLVVASDGKTGYVATRYLSTQKPAPKVSAADRLRAKVVALAKQQLGVRYVLNQASPSVGFDCSGLVWYVYRQVGIAVPRTSWEYARFGKSVKLSEIKPGDVVLWDLKKDGIQRVDHVGIYVGNGMMIHAAGGGKDVRYQRISTYSLTFLGVRRIIP